MVKYAEHQFSVKGELSLRKSNLVTTDHILPYKSVYIGGAYLKCSLLIHTVPLMGKKLNWKIDYSIEKSLPKVCSNLLSYFIQMILNVIHAVILPE